MFVFFSCETTPDILSHLKLFLLFTATHPFVSLLVTPDGCQETFDVARSHQTPFTHGQGVESIDKQNVCQVMDKKTGAKYSTKTYVST